jgi:hypothetical protein
MDWELLIKVATIIIGGLTLIDKSYELVKKRRARQRIYRRPIKSENFLNFLKKKLSGLHFSPPGELVLLSNFMGAALLIKKILKAHFTLDTVNVLAVYNRVSPICSR